jgi:hypothetical protein
MTRRVVGRKFDDDERAILRTSAEDFTRRYEGSSDLAESLLRVGDSQVDTSIGAPTQAAWMMVATEILNLDEGLNK